VSGVQNLGISPDELPLELLEECRKAMDARVERGEVPDTGDGHWLMSVLREAYDATSAQGATTVLLAAMEDCRRLAVAHVGDCALLLLRPVPDQPFRLTRVYRTDPLRYEANKPVQVMRLSGSPPSESHLVIRGARVNTVPCRPGDLLVLGSDGLFDNLGDEDINEIVEAHCAGIPVVGESSELDVRCSGPESSGSPCGAPEDLEQVPGRGRPTVQQLARAARALVDAAIANVRTDALEGPEEEPSWEAARREKPGGNADDTTVLVAAIVEAGEDSDGDDESMSGEVALQMGWRRAKGGAKCGPEPWPGGLLGGLLMPQCCNTARGGEEYEESVPYVAQGLHPPKDIIIDSEYEDEKDGCAIS